METGFLQKTNYHTHSDFCDGRNSVEEIILAAIEKKFTILGFSSHSLFPHADSWQMPSARHEEYFSCVRSLAQKYSDKIKIYCGLEADFVPNLSSDFAWQFGRFSPDYLIGSVHYVLGNGAFFTVDDKAQKVAEGLRRVFKGDGKKAVCEYFSLQREMLRTQRFLILGHADVIRVRNGELKFFSESEGWYKKELRATAKEAARAGVIVEINTGGLARGVLDDVYPSAEFLDILHQANVPITFSSDAHEARTLDFAFDRAELAAIRAGYTEAAYFEDGKIKFRPLDGRLKF